MQDIFKRDSESFKKFAAFAKKVSDMDDPRIMGKRQHIGGAFSAIQFKEKPDKNWVRAYSDYPGFYRLSSRASKELVEEWKSCSDPIPNSELTSLFGLREGVYGEGHKWYSRPATMGVGDFFIVDVNDDWASSVVSFPGDMVEIMASEYLTLKQEKGNAEK